MKQFKVQELAIAVSEINGTDYFSLTDLAQKFEGGSSLIVEWMRNKKTIDFLFDWETKFNPKFSKQKAIDNFINKSYDSSYKLSIKNWGNVTDAIGVKASCGRYGKSIAHKYICLNFMIFLNPNFLLTYMIDGEKDFTELISIFNNLSTLNLKKLPTFIYLIKNNQNGYYKIGVSENPNYREKTLQSQEPDIITIVSKKYDYTINTYKIEKDLHNKYDEKRLRGEWFDLEEFEVNEITNFLNN